MILPGELLFLVKYSIKFRYDKRQFPLKPQLYAILYRIFALEKYLLK